MDGETKRSDRRVRYTKAMLRDALTQMMRTQHISGISVKALCEKADVNRSTFYTHYTDVYDLLHRIEREVLTDLRSYLEREDGTGDLPITAQAMTRILEYLQANADLCKALLSENCDFAFQKDIMALAEVVSAKAYQTLDPRMREYVQEFGIAGCIAIVQKWLHDGCIESPARMADMILMMTYHGAGR